MKTLISCYRCYKNVLKIPLSLFVNCKLKGITLWTQVFYFAFFIFYIDLFLLGHVTTYNLLAVFNQLTNCLFMQLLLMGNVKFK